MSYRPRNNTIQERIVELLNTKMIVGVWYPYSDIRSWTTGYKEGTLSSVLSKCKGIGALEYNNGSGDRARTREIDYQDMLNFSKTYRTVSNNLGVTQVVCDKVKALKQVDFTTAEVSTVLNLNEAVITDIINCEFNVHKYNDYWRESTAPKEPKTQEIWMTQDGLENMASKVKDAVDELVNTVFHLAATK
jgi:hypothetical protein